MPPMQANNAGGSGNGNSNNNCPQLQQRFTRCCLPSGDCLKLDGQIALDDVFDCVRVLCNNENCNVGQYMHRQCFESWEQTVLLTLKTVGRARSWSDRQRLQNLWTKKGYDLVYKACGCKCGRGHLRKDLEWTVSQAAQKSKNRAGNYIVAGNTSVGSQRLTNGATSDDAEAYKKKKKRNRNNQKPALVLGALNSDYYLNSQEQQQQQQQIGQQSDNSTDISSNIAESVQLSIDNVDTSNNSANNNRNVSPKPNVGVIGSGLHNYNHKQQLETNMANKVGKNVSSNISGSLSNGHGGNILGLDLRARTRSLSSSRSCSTSPHSSDISISPTHHTQQQEQQHQSQFLQLYQQSILQKGFGRGIMNGIGACPASGTSDGQTLAATESFQQQSAVFSSDLRNIPCIDQQQFVQQQKNKEVEMYSERVRSTSGCNGIFSRRLDFSSFNLLPKTRLNSYQVKIEDEGNHGNDETRLFILSSLAQSQMSRVACILCEEPLLVFDRYPLVDGSFFLSPKQHSAGCIEVKYEGRTFFLTCVCMGCLDGTATKRVIKCRFCGEIWDGSNLVLGTMYAYDIFAAMPCCAERLKCNNCFKLLLHPQQPLNFYSDYSHCVTCPYCTTQDTHFVKPLSYCYTKRAVARPQLIA